MNKVQNAIIEFGNYNQIKMDKYASDEYMDTVGNEEYIPDNYIGKDLFEEHVNNWLEFFDEEDKDVFLELLKHYRYFTRSQFRKIMNEFRRVIIEKLSLEIEQDNVLVITFPSKRGVASGGDVIRAIFEEVSIGKFKKHQIISDTDKVDIKILDEIKYIFFVDDLVGSGTTMYGNIRGTYEKLQLNLKPDIKLFIITIYANEERIKKKIKELEEKENILIDSLYIHEGAQKCFEMEQLGDRNKREEYRAVVEKYEQLIEKNKLDGDEEKDSILGFQKGQLLVSFHYNTPNNTLSTFWRPSTISVPLFIRNTYIRPSVKSIREKKKRFQENGYKMRKLQNGIKSE